MIRVRAAQDGKTWHGRYNTGKFWHTVRNDDDGEAVSFGTQADAEAAARDAWWDHVRRWKGSEK